MHNYLEDGLSRWREQEAPRPSGGTCCFQRRPCLATREAEAGVTAGGSEGKGELGTQARRDPGSTSGLGMGRDWLASVVCKGDSDEESGKTATRSTYYLLGIRLNTSSQGYFQPQESLNLIIKPSL